MISDFPRPSPGGCGEQIEHEEYSLHEMSYMIRLADIAIKECETHKAASPHTLVVEVGELTGVLPHYLQKYYPAVIQGTKLEGSALEVIRVPSEAVCDECGQHYHPEKEMDYRCPACRSLKARFIHGRELSVREIRF